MKISNATKFLGGLVAAILLSFPHTKASGVPAVPASSGSSTTYLPIIFVAPDYIYSDEALLAVNRLNSFRLLAGLPPLNLDPAATEAAQHHVTYTALNSGDLSAFTRGPHIEILGKPGFTGETPYDRMVAAGYAWPGGSEIMHYWGDPIKSVDGWMATIYHRMLALDPKATEVGYASGYGSTCVDVMDFGFGPENGSMPPPPYPLAYPADGQTGIPLAWDGNETPSPIPSNASRPVGYPFTLQGIGGALHVEAIEIKSMNGAPIALHPNPMDCPAYNCYALIPVSPLKANTTYRITARGRVGEASFNRTWTFTTGSQ